MDVKTFPELWGVGLKNYHSLNGAIICHTGVTLKKFLTQVISKT